MGSGLSRTSDRRRRPKLKRAVSSILLCGSSAASSQQINDYPTESRLDSVDHGHPWKLKFFNRKSLSSLACEDVVSIKSGNVVNSARCLASDERPTFEVCSNNVEPGSNGKWFSESMELISPHQFVADSVAGEPASSSYANHFSPDCVCSNEGSCVDDPLHGINHFMNQQSSQLVERPNNGRLYSPGPRGSVLDKVSIENNVSEDIDCSNSDFSSSLISDSPLYYHSSVDNLREVNSSVEGAGEEQNRVDRSILQVDLVSTSPNSLSTSSSEMSSRELRRNSRRLFWDAFSRRYSRRQSDTGSGFSPNGSDNLRSRERWLLDSRSSLLSNENETESRPGESRTEGINVRTSRSEIWGNADHSIDSRNHSSSACPRGIHAHGSCSSQSSSSEDHSGPRAGFSRIVLLAEALFEVLDQIHQQPMPLSLSMVALPAPESIVDSFPVKTHLNSDRSEFSGDISRCYICLDDYEEGDKIRVLPCHHEYHVCCVDKWLKEIHGVCPLCRADVHEGFRGDSNSP